jgi:hypothetical protein
MHELSRPHLLNALDDWGAYPEKFERLPPERQAAFLQDQGFAALQDLLGHVIGWWQQGRRVVGGVQADPAFVYDEPDTDAFNADLTLKYHSWDPADVLDHFEKERQAMKSLVHNLPGDVLAAPLVREWLIADVIEHLEEHAIKG